MTYVKRILKTKNTQNSRHRKKAKIVFRTAQKQAKIWQKNHNVGFIVTFFSLSENGQFYNASLFQRTKL